MTAYDQIIDRSGAEALIPEEAAREIFQELPQSSVVMSTARQLPPLSRNTQRLPVLSVLPTAYFVGEAPTTPATGSTKKTTSVEWENKFLNVAEIAVIVPIPESVLDDSAYDIWAEVRPLVTEAIGRVFDAAVLYSVNKPAEWPTGIVPAAIAAENAVALGTGEDLYDDILGADGLVAKVEQDGFFPSGYVASLGMRGRLRGLRTEDGLPIFKALTREGVQGNSVYELDGQEIRFPLNGVMDEDIALMIAGAWNRLVWAPRTDITFKLLDQAVITDPTDNNKIIYNLAQQDMVALRAVMRCAWQVPNPINRINPDAETRYPFSVLTPAVSV